MSDDRWHTVLVLGGIRSGKSAFAESLVALTCGNAQSLAVQLSSGDRTSHLD